MPRSRVQTGAVDQICLESEPTGVCAVYLVETETSREAQELAGLFEQFASVLDVIPLSSGKLTTYAVRLVGQEQNVLDEIESLLKKNFGFVILHRSFNEQIYEIVRELCKDTGSRLNRIPICDICGRAEPFPATRLKFLDRARKVLASRTYCSTCTTEYMGQSSKKFLTSLLEADKGEFRIFSRMHLVKSRSSKKHLAFRIKTDAEQQFVMR